MSSVSSEVESGPVKQTDENKLSNINPTVDHGETSRNLKKRLKDDDDSESPEPAKRAHLDSANNASVVATHYNKLEEKGIFERSKSPIFYLRNFNNWIKTMLIDQYLWKLKDRQQINSRIHVLDMCCGKGGDLPKWERGKIKHLVCTDIAKVSVEQCKSRYDALKSRIKTNRQFSSIFSAEFIASDSTKDRLRQRYKDASIEFHLVSCQFAFHYCFESKEQVECMLKNASECLKTDGYFIGTMPNAEEIMERQRKANAPEFGNKVYGIKFAFDTDKPPPKFGGKYNFFLEGVVDCPEFLVDFPTLIDMAAKFGLKLVLKETFEGFFEKNVTKRHGRLLIDRMQALQTDRPRYQNRGCVEEPKPKPNKDDIKELFAGHSNSREKVGYLSTDEWEVTSMYIAFAFQKVATKWNSEGKPEYDL